MNARPMTLVLGTAAGAFLAAGLTSLATLPVAHADPAAVGNAVTADQFSDLLTGEGTPADNAVDNFYQGIANFFAPEAAGSAAMADLPAANAADADGITISNPPGPDPDFLSGPLQNFGMFSMQGFADPDEHFDAAVMSIPSLGITDLLTSGIDPSDHLALADPGLGLPADLTAGTVDSTVNTFHDAMAPALDPLLSFSLPFTDPLTDLWVALLPLGA